MTERKHGRAADALRSIRVERGYLRHAQGSCMFQLGDTWVLCAANISDGVPQWRRGSGSGWLTAEYALLPASTHTRTRRESSSGGPKGRTQEIQRLIGRSLRAIVDMEAMGESTLTVDCDVIQADGGTRTAAITGAYIAVHDALTMWRDAGRMESLPLLERIAATSVGLVDGREYLDLDYSEDSAAEIDMNVVMDGRGRIIEIQGTGERTPFDRARLNMFLDLAEKGVSRLLDVQTAVLSGEADGREF